VKTHLQKVVVVVVVVVVRRRRRRRIGSYMQINQIVPVSSPGQETVRGAEDAYGPVFTK
jgi:hypothetical protein